MTRIVEPLKWTQEAWIQLAKEAEQGIVGNFVPMIEVDLEAFRESLHLEGTYSDFVLRIPTAEKKQWFEQCGFTVLTFAHSIITVDRFLTAQSNDPSIEQQFLDQKRQVFIVNANRWDKDFFAVLEYASDDPLAKYTVDYAEVKAAQERRARTKAFMDNMRAKRKD